MLPKHEVEGSNPFARSKLICSFKKDDFVKTQIMTPLEAFQAIKEKRAILVDVRELDEVQEGMAEPAIWFSVYEMDDGSALYTSFLQSLDKSKEIILYCRSGKRSGLATQLLSDKGFKATNLGGFEDWAAAGLPVRKGP